LLASASSSTPPGSATETSLTTVEERFDAVVEALLEVDGVAPPAPVRSGFGSGALKIHGKIFAMLVRGTLVVKLPAKRVSAAIAAGQGVAFDANKGRPMREWLAVPPDSTLDWLSTAREALAFVDGRRDSSSSS
jgi:hypothetical protein